MNVLSSNQSGKVREEEEEEESGGFPYTLHNETPTPAVMISIAPLGKANRNE